MITKLQASEAFGYGYMIEYLGHLAEANQLFDDCIVLKMTESWSRAVPFDKFGTEAKILCRPFSHLTTEITVEGETFVPIERILTRTEWFSIVSKCKDFRLTHNGNGVFMEYTDINGKELAAQFRYSEAHGFSLTQFEPTYEYENLLTNQHELFTKLKQWGFSFFDDSVVKWMEG